MAGKGQDGESRERQGVLRPLGQTLPSLLRPLLKERPAAEASLLLDWSAIVGAEIAALAEPLSVRFPRQAERRDGVLELSCDGPAALELQHRASQVIERVNAYLGYPAVTRLKLRQNRRPSLASAAPAPAAPARLQPLDLPATGHEPLDRALGFLAAAIAAREKRDRDKKARRG